MICQIKDVWYVGRRSIAWNNADLDASISTIYCYSSSIIIVKTKNDNLDKRTNRIGKDIMPWRNKASIFRKWSNLEKTMILNGTVHFYTMITRRILMKLVRCSIHIIPINLRTSKSSWSQLINSVSFFIRKMILMRNRSFFRHSSILHQQRTFKAHQIIPNHIIPRQIQK